MRKLLVHIGLGDKVAVRVKGPKGKSTGSRFARCTKVFPPRDSF